jgi:hypothetical protein
MPILWLPFDFWVKGSNLMKITVKNLFRFKRFSNAASPPLAVKRCQVCDAGRFEGYFFSNLTASDEGGPVSV